MSKKNAGLKDLSYRDLEEKLEALVMQLESDKLDLENAVAAYEEATKLLAEAGERLTKAEQQVILLKPSAEKSEP